MAKNTVKLKNYLSIMEEYTSTAVALTPGHLVELTSDGLVQKHSIAGGDVLPPMFVCEDELQGKGVETALDASSRVQVWIPTRGDQVYALLKDGETISIGEALESAGDGTLKAHVAASDTVEYSNAIVGVALEALDLAGGVSAVGRIKIRIV